MRAWIAATALACAFVVSSLAAGPEERGTRPVGEAAPAAVCPSFVEGRGDVAFSAVGLTRTALFTDTGMTLRVRDGERRAAVTMSFDGARAVRPRGDGAQGAPRHRISGGATPRTETFRSFGGIVYDEPWQGIDVRFDARPGAIEYTVEVARAADPSRVRFGFDGARGVSRTTSGALSLDTAAGEVFHSAPIAWQDAGGRRAPVTVAFDVRASSVGFALGPYDRSLPLVIDPGFTMDTVATGLSGDDFLIDFEVAADGSVFAAGKCAFAAAIPAGKAAYDATISGVYDGFLAKLDREGVLVWATFLGGDDDGEELVQVGVDGQGRPIVLAATGSNDYPLAVGPRTHPRRDEDFLAVTKLSADGATLVWSGWVGGDYSSLGNLAVDSAGAAYVLGRTSSAYTPTNVLDPDVPAGSGGSFVEKISPGGSQVWGVLIQGSRGRYNEPYALAVDAAGAAYAGGYVFGTGGLPRADVELPYAGGTGDAYVVKIHPSGTRAEYAVHFGGSSGEGARSLSIAADGAAYVGGNTGSDTTTFPRSVGTIPGTSSQSPGNGYALKIAPQGDRLLWNRAVPEAPRVALDDSGRLYLLTGQGLFRTNPDGVSAETLQSANSPFGGVAVAPGTGSRYWVQSTRYHLVRFVNLLEDVPSPTQVNATPDGARTVAIEWVAGRGDETGWIVERQEPDGDGGFIPIATLPPAARQHEDATALPDTRYLYRVVALRGDDRSCDSPVAAARTAESFELDVLSGLQIDHRGTDIRLKLGVPLESVASFDPLTTPLRVSVFNESGIGGARLDVPAGDVGWSIVRKRRFRWESAPGAPLRARVDLDPARRRIAVRVRTATFFEGLVSKQAVVRLGVAEDAGSALPVWVRKRRNTLMVN